MQAKQLLKNKSNIKKWLKIARERVIEINNKIQKGQMKDKDFFTVLATFDYRGETISRMGSIVFVSINRDYIRLVPKRKDDYNVYFLSVDEDIKHIAVYHENSNNKKYID